MNYIDYRKEKNLHLKEICFTLLKHRLFSPTLMTKKEKRTIDIILSS